MPAWRDELIEAAKSKAEREAEEAERYRKRVEEALLAAQAAFDSGLEALRFTHGLLRDKNLPAELHEEKDLARLTLRELSLTIQLVRETAAIKVVSCEAKPREFDFAKDRHIAPADVEEYMGRRALEVVRAAQKTAPW